MKRRIAVTAALATVLAGIVAIAPQATARATCDPFLTDPVYSGQTPTAIDEFGFDFGSQEVTVGQSNRYLAAVDAASDRVVIGTAARSVGGLPLRYAIVGDPNRLTPDALAEIRQGAASLRDPLLPSDQASDLVGTMPTILWIAANVHGTEESGTDASLKVLYELADRVDCVTSRILREAIVVILPIQNPDGRREQTRRNLYGFDMNRDWFARTQPETDGKLELVRKYPPMLFVDAHEFGDSDFLFPPTADPEYHETPDTVHDWIFDGYSPAIAGEFDRLGLDYHHGAPYDFFASIFGDTVPAVGFHAAGMTFEKDNGDPIDERTNEQFIAMWASLFEGSTQANARIQQWHDSFVTAYHQGRRGLLEPNAVFEANHSLFQEVPEQRVRHYFLMDTPNRQFELQTLVRRLQRMDVSVYRLTAPLDVGDFHAYARDGSARTLPAGTYWIPMAQGQKHWIQAMLNEDSYIPFEVTYDVTAWSNPLLMNISGGWAGEVLNPSASLVAPVASPPPPSLPADLPRIGLFETPNSTRGFEAAGQTRYLFDQVWELPYRNVSAEAIVAGLRRIDVLVAPDGYANYALQALGSKGKRALRDWVNRGGRFVGWQGGAEVAVKAGLSTIKLSTSHSNAPGTLMRVVLDRRSALTRGIGRSVWVMYADDDLMVSDSAVAQFPAASSPAFGVAGLADDIGRLAGKAVVSDEPVGAGRVVTFAVDPNFRAWTLGTQRVLWNAVVEPVESLARAPSAGSPERALAETRAIASARLLPRLGSAIRLAVGRGDQAIAASLLRDFGLTAQRVRLGQVTLFLVSNRRDLGAEEHPDFSALIEDMQARGADLRWASIT